MFSYGGITWDTGDESGGVNGLADPTQTSYPARIGYSNGTGDSGTYYEVPGSGSADAFLGMTGAYTFPIRDTSVGLTAYRTGGNYGQAVSTAVQQSGDPANYVNLVDDGTDLANDGTTTNIQYNDQLIADNKPVDVSNQNLAHITLKQVQPEPGTSLNGTVESLSLLPTRLPRGYSTRTAIC